LNYTRMVYRPYPAD